MWLEKRKKSRRGSEKVAGPSQFCGGEKLFRKLNRIYSASKNAQRVRASERDETRRDKGRVEGGQCDPHGQKGHLPRDALRCACLCLRLCSCVCVYGRPYVCECVCEAKVLLSVI